MDRDNKVELTYTLAERLIDEDLTFNSFPVRGKCPVDRVSSWIQAFKRVNAPSLKQLDEGIVAQLSRLKAKDIGRNGCWFLATRADDWFNHFVSIQFLKPTERVDTEHYDGGASVLHMGLSLWGRRQVFLHLAAPAENRDKASSSDGNPNSLSFEWQETNQRPGSVYLGNFSAVKHQVKHEGAYDSNEMYHSSRGGIFKVAVMIRTSCFSAARARATSSPAGPKIVNTTVCKAIHHALISGRLRLPRLSECLAHHASSAAAST